MKTLCIYHGNCADGFGAAWALWKAKGDAVEFYPGVHGDASPDVAGRDVVLVDFSYKRGVMLELGRVAKSILIIDHHKTAEDDLFLLGTDAAQEYATCQIQTIFDMTKSGAVLTWEHFHPGTPVPRLLRHIQDRDLWRFSLPGTRQIQADVFSRPYDFSVWDEMVDAAETTEGRATMVAAGSAIERKHFKDITELLAVTTREMVIGGHLVPVANSPPTMASDAAGKLASAAPFAATYFDKPGARVFSLRSRGSDGMDVSEIAKRYGGGGHRNASGFTAPAGWEGDVAT